MKSINYLDKGYQRGIADLAIDSRNRAGTLIVLNGPGRRDLNAVKRDITRVSKKTIYASRDIIDTESRLDGVFTRAHKKQEVLFFDEADALFGKRSEVKDSHDRYANIEVSHLLERIDRFDGIVILVSSNRTTLNSLLLSKSDIVIGFPLFRTFFRKVFVNLTSYSSRSFRSR